MSENAFRPTSFKDFQGQDKAKKMLQIYIKAAQLKGECLDHVLITAPSGAGKTTTAGIIAAEMGKELKTVSGPSLKKNEQVVDFLMSIQPDDIVLLDEIHSVPKKLQETIFLAMEQFIIDADDECGVIARINIPKFTLIGATTDVGDLLEPIKNRFPINIALRPYEDEHMAHIVMRHFQAMDVEISYEAALMIGRCGRGVPRKANNYSRRVYDYALVINDGVVSPEIVREAFDFMEINPYGLTASDIDYLTYLAQAGKPVGVDNLALALGTKKNNLINDIEPYLMREEYIVRTPRGRKITEKGKLAVSENL